MREFREYLKAVLYHWEPGMSGVFATFFIWLIGWLYEQRHSTGAGTLPWYYYIFVASGFVFYSGYCAWRDNNRSLRTARQQLANVKTQLGDQIDDIFQGLVFGQGSGLTPFAKLSQLQTQAHYLWIDLERAEEGRKPILIRKLARNLKQQHDLEAFQRPSNKGQELFYKVVGEMERLRAIARTLQLPDIDEL